MGFRSPVKLHTSPVDATTDDECYRCLGNPLYKNLSYDHFGHVTLSFGTLPNNLIRAVRAFQHVCFGVITGAPRFCHNSILKYFKWTKPLHFITTEFDQNSIRTPTHLKICFRHDFRESVKNFR